MSDTFSYASVIKAKNPYVAWNISNIISQTNTMMKLFKHSLLILAILLWCLLFFYYLQLEGIFNLLNY